MRDGFQRLLSAFLALVFVGFVVSLLCIESHTPTKAKDSADWPSTDGVVLSTDYDRTTLGRRTSNRPHVTYSYQFQEKSFTSNVYSFGDGITESELFAQYPSGRRVIVFYDPAHPQEATLVKGVGNRTMAGMRYAQVFLGLALAFLAYVTISEVKRRRNSQKETPSNGG